MNKTTADLIREREEAVSTARLAQDPERYLQSLEDLAEIFLRADSYLPALQRLVRSGFAVRHVALGPDAQAATRRIRAAGIVAAQATLAPDWRNADALVVAG